MLAGLSMASVERRRQPSYFYVYASSKGLKPSREKKKKKKKQMVCLTGQPQP